MGAPILQNCPFTWGIWTHLTRFLGTIGANQPNGTWIGSAVLAEMTAECPYTLQWFASESSDRSFVCLFIIASWGPPYSEPQHGP